ncbi:hypothetical protein B0T16DRAFT_402498 [Cercophora newfieldiana]|uniref:Transmembrane protein n=1 Tax=Cercophora newfieldiana TaxID=92897 RepID=A0AA40CZV8_9PEZI|nr:hypothetical protein B0T16DRAFT_402498 [Cercophora newfieldiana]
MPISAPLRTLLGQDIRPVQLQKQEWRSLTDDLDYRPSEPLIRSNERPKVLVRTDLNHSLIQFSLFHIPPVAVTLGLLSVYVLRISWGVGNDVLAALLFAAKVHEAMIIASLFHILYYHIRRGLLSSDGIPFGFLTAAFQLSSPFYLLNSSFIAPLLRYRPATLSFFVLAVLMVFTFTLAALVGASSGVVMLPRFDWWKLELSQINASLSATGSGARPGFSQLVISPVERLYPQRIDLQGYPSDCGNGLSMCDLASETEYTEAGTFAWSWIAKKAEGRFLPENITFDNRVMAWKEFNVRPGFVTAATIPVLAIAREIRNAGGTTADGWGARYPFPSRISPSITDQTGRSLPTRQPRVATQCIGPSLQHQGGNDTFYRYQLEPSPGIYPELDIEVDRSFLIASANASATPFGFVDLKATLSMRTSAVLWVWDAAVRQQRGPTLCFVDARWVDSDLWVMPQNGQTPQFSYKLQQESLNATENVEDMIDLDLAWLESLNNITVSVPVNATSFRRPRMFDYLYRDILALPLSGGSNDPDSVQIRLTSSASWSMTNILTNILSGIPRTSGHGVQATSRSILGPFNATLITQKMPLEGGGIEVKDLLAQPSYARIGPVFEHNIYEYNFDSTTTKLAWAVLLTHVLLVLIHFVVTCVHGNWHSSAWSQLGDLLALAMNTRPTELLRNTGVAVKDWDTWRLTAYVRVSDGDSIGLELRDKSVSRGYSDNRHIPETNQAYG